VRPATKCRRQVLQQEVRHRYSRTQESSSRAALSGSAPPRNHRACRVLGQRPNVHGDCRTRLAEDACSLFPRPARRQAPRSRRSQQREFDGGMAQSATQTPLCRRYPVRKLLRKMVGPCGLEPQTSTVSIWWPHDYGLLLKATKCRCVKKMRSLWCFHHNRSYVVNFGDKTRSVLNSVFNSICKRFGGRDRDRTADPLLAKIARTKNQ
jgi:hypothetical protein